MSDTLTGAQWTETDPLAARPASAFLAPVPAGENWVTETGELMVTETGEDWIL